MRTSGDKGGVECVFHVVRELANYHPMKITISSLALFSDLLGVCLLPLNQSGLFDCFGKCVMAKSDDAVQVLGSRPLRD